MRKLLLFLSAIVMLGINAQAAKLVVEKPNGWSNLYVWWWGGDITSASLGYDWDKSHPDMLNPTAYDKDLGVTEQKGSDGKTYLVMEIDDKTTALKLAKGGELAFNGSDPVVYSFSNNNYTASTSKVSDIIKENQGGETTTDKYYLIHGQIFGNTSWSDDTTGKTLSSNGVWTITINATAEGNFGIKDLGTTGEKQENWLNYNSFTYADGATNYVGSGDDNNIKLKSKGEYTISIDFNKTKPVFSITPKNENPVTPTFEDQNYRLKGTAVSNSNTWSYLGDATKSVNGVWIVSGKLYAMEFGIAICGTGNDQVEQNKDDHWIGSENYTNVKTTFTEQAKKYVESSGNNIKVKAEGEYTITLTQTGDKAYTLDVTPKEAYKVLVGYSASWTPTERGEIKDGVWTWTMPANTNGGVSIYVEKNGVQESYGQDNYKNGETKVLDSSKNYVYFAKNVPVKLSLDLATLKLTATWEEGTVTNVDRNFRIHGKIINGSEWKDGEMSKSSNNVWSTTGDFVKGEFGIKICGDDGNQLKDENDKDAPFWIGGEGHTGTSTTLTETAAKYIENSGSNFNLRADGKYTFTLTQKTPTTFTLDVTTDVEAPEAEKTYTVYFVNKGNWSDVHVWAYTNLSKYPEGHENAGQDIPEAQKNNVLSGQTDAYNYAPSIKADRAKGLETLIEGGYEVYKYIITNELWQQLIFYRNSGDNITNGKTRNLFVVDGGVYFPDDELLPSNIYDTSLPEHQRFQAYPTATKSTEYNVIYIDVPDFGYNRNEVKIEITYERDGVKYEATGKPGTTLLEPVTIAGKQFLRLELTEAVIPNGTNMNLNVYMNGHTCSDNPHKDDEHHGCSDPQRPLVYSNIVYADGNVYSRGETKHIRDLVKPVDFYLVPMSDGFKLSDESVTPVTLTDVEEGNEINAFRFIAKEEEGKLIYRTTNVPVKEKFTFLARFENTDSEGNKTYVYSWFSNEEDLEITRGNWYDIEMNNKNTFSILQRSNAITHYQLTVNWNDQRINVLPVKNSANFALAVETKDGFVRDYDGFAVVNAVADDIYKTDENGNIVYGENNKPVIAVESPFETFTISHNADLTADELNNISVSMSRKSTYNKYFGSENPKNQPAEAHPDHGYQVIDESKANGFELGTVKAKAHTAGVCLVVLKHVPADQSENGDFDASTYQFPVRVRPTLQSIDLVTNHMTHLISGDNNGIELQYTTDGSMNHTDDNGMVWTVERPRFNAYMAEETSDLELWWKYSDGTAEEDPAENEVNTLPAFRGEAANTIVAAAESALTVDTETLEHPSTQGYTKYDRNSTPNLTKAVNGLDFVVKQNGILGEPQHVIVKEVKALSPTEVDEIESAEEVEAVYYDLNGVRVNGDNLAKGLYIVVKGNTAEKIYVK